MFSSKKLLFYFYFWPFYWYNIGLWWLLPAVSSTEGHHVDAEWTSVIGHFHQFHDITERPRQKRKETVTLRVNKHTVPHKDPWGRSHNMQREQMLWFAEIQLSLKQHSCIYIDHKYLNNFKICPKMWASILVIIFIKSPFHTAILINYCKISLNDFSGKHTNVLFTNANGIRSFYGKISQTL